MLKRNTLIGLPPRFLDLPMKRPQVLTSLLLLASIFGLARTSQAQALPAAEKTGRIDLFGSYTFTQPDYGRENDNGFSVGGDYALRRFIFGTPAVAGRYSRVTGPTATETFVGGGLESHYKISVVRPYVMALFGLGGVDVSRAHYSDSGNELLLGGGADVPLTRRFSARGEFAYGFLHISGRNGTAAGAIDLNPSSVNVGVVYHLR